MKSSIKITLLLFFGLFLAVSNISNNNNNNNFSTDKINDGLSVEHEDNTFLKSPKQSGYWDNFSFIHITGSNWSTAASYEWCSGSGSKSNPYTIENMTIDASSSPTGNGIWIGGSKNDYFIIRNVTVYNAGNGPFDAGIRLQNTNRGNLTDNNCSNNGNWGIAIYWYSDFNTISGNTANNNADGIVSTVSCNNNTISGNNANNNTDTGIYLYDNCTNNTISGNTAANVGTTDQDIGISLESNCNNNTISGNTAYNNAWYGIQLTINSSNNKITGNNASNFGPYNQQWGISIESNCDNNTISGNTANWNWGDAGIWLVSDCDNNVISGNTVNNNVMGTGIDLNGNCINNTISGNIINNNDDGIWLYGNCENNTISGNTIDNNGGYGINIDQYCDNNTISGNNITYNTQHGINLFECENITISGNNVSYNTQKGIYASYRNYNTTISGNTITNNGQYGIHIEGSHNITIVKNEIKYNDWEGIYIDSANGHYIFDNNITNNGQAGAYNGIYLEGSDWNKIIGNRINNNTDDGIELKWSCSRNTISGNDATNNTLYGINLDSNCGDNTISENNITGNDHGIYITTNCGDNIIYGNSIDNSDNEGIELISNCNYNTIIGNTLNNNPIVDGGTNNILAMNCMNDIYSNLSIDNANGPWGTFTWEEVVQYVPWIGSDGSWSDPYVIEDLNIDAGGSGSGIAISNSKNYYFIIKNCTVTHTGNNPGIQLSNTNNGTLTNNDCSANGCGIYLNNNCDNNTISGNIINNHGYFGGTGIILSDHCDNNKISGNTANNNNFCGIWLLSFCDNNTISGNTAKKCGTTGIILMDDCINNTISGNTANNNLDFGIQLIRRCHNNTISGNNVSNVGLLDQNFGIRLEQNSHNNTISGNNASYNTQSGIILYDNCSNNKITGNNATNNAENGLILTNIGLPCTNNTISGNNFSYNTQKGIYFYSYCYNNSISGNTVNYNGIGIYLDDNCDYNTISGNNASFNLNVGICFSTYCNNNTISGNNASNNGVGIFMNGNSNYNTISGNIINNNTQNGIYITGSNNMISGNNVNYNLQNGIYLALTDNNKILGNNASYNTEYGIWAEGCSTNNPILGNNANNNQIGILVYQSSDIEVSGNNVNNNTQYGIWLKGSCANCLLYNNKFNNNTIHARHDGGSNSWNNSVIGNYWDNYTGFDVNRDGIGDTPYSIPDITDYLPIWTISNSNVSIDLPTNNTLWATPPPLKIRTFHLSNHSNWYNVSGNPNIAFLQNNTQENLDINLWDSLDEGQFQISFYFNDTSGFIYDSATYTLYKDTQAPIITLSSPSDGEYFSVAPPTYNVRVVDQNPFTMWYSLNNLYNITLTTNGTLNLGNWTALPEGPVTLRFYAVDILGNLHTSTINIFKDTKKPSLTISAPGELQVYVNEVPEFDLTITDASPYIIWYSLNNGRNISCSASGRIDAEEWNALSDGIIRIKFYVQDAAGNLISIELDVQKTTINWSLIFIIIGAVALAVAGLGLLARRSRIRTRERDVKIVAFLEGQRSAITENDISIYKEQHICLVHKGKIDGISYICPSCGSFYCMKCYDALKELENECWSCRNPFDASKPVKSFGKYKSVRNIDDGKKRKGIKRSIIEVSERTKSTEDGVKKKGLTKSTEIIKKADLKRASLMATTAPKLKEPIQKAPLKSQTEINQIEQKIDYVKKKLEDIEFSAEIGLITEEKYLRKKESLEPILNSLKEKLDQIKK